MLWILVPGFFVGVAVFDSLRRVFSEDKTLVWRLLKDQPATMTASATVIGSTLVWAVLSVIGVV